MHDETEPVSGCNTRRIILLGHNFKLNVILDNNFDLIPN